MMRWGMPPPPRTGGPPITNIRNTSSWGQSGVSFFGPSSEPENKKLTARVGP
jgi:hypothetical protein